MLNILPYIAIFLLIMASAFFSSSEIAFAAVNKTRLKARTEENPTVFNRFALKIKEKYDEFLSAILIGNNLVNNAASSIATVIVIGFLGENYAFVSTIIMTLLVLTFGEILPKVFAKQFPEELATKFSLPIYVIAVIFKPVTYVVMLFVNLVSKLWENGVSDSEAVSGDDLENIIDIAEDEGVLDEEQCDLLQNALEFEDVAAYEIITPRVDMDALDIRDPYEVNLQKIFESGFSRLPVYEDTPDNIIGVLLVNRFFKEMVDNEQVSIRELLIPVTSVHKTMPLPDVLEKMKENKCHLVVVLDEYGGTMGILTMEDVLEQLVGEIFDETDEIEPEFVCIDDTHFEADGAMRVYDFFDEFDIDIEDNEDFDEDTATIGGFVTDLLEGEVKEGAEVTFENILFRVTEAEEMRIIKLSAEIIRKETEED